MSQGADRFEKSKSRYQVSDNNLSVFPSFSPVVSENCWYSARVIPRLKRLNFPQIRYLYCNLLHVIYFITFAYFYYFTLNKTIGLSKF